MTIDFDGPYDKAMKQVEDLAYYANAEDNILKRLLQRGKPIKNRLKDRLSPEQIAELKEEYPCATD